MRLTRVLQVFFPLKKKTPGLTYHGKNQKHKPIKTSHKYEFVNRLMREEQNKKYLMNPYLTVAQEEAYGQAHGREKRNERFKAFVESRRKPFFPDRKIEEQLNKNLAKLKSWE